MEDNSTHTGRTQKIPRTVILRAPRLLHMKYTVREVSDEIQLAERTLRDWLNLYGVPHFIEAGQTWIIGTEFAAWVEQQRQSRLQSKQKLAENEFYCMRCRAIVFVKETISQQFGAKALKVSGRCPNCDAYVFKGASHHGNDRAQ